MTTEKKMIVITMSETSPVKLDPEQWPVIAEAENHDGKLACQANTEWLIRVREHADGRRIVYGSRTAGNGGQYAGFRETFAGYLLPSDRDYQARDGKFDPEADTIRAIRRVAGVIGDETLGAECIGDLPAREL